MKSRFYGEVRRRVAMYFATRSLRPYATPRIYLKTAVMLCWFGLSYGLFLGVDGAWWWTGFLGVSTGLSLAGLGFNVVHDGSHGAYSSRRSVNRAMSLVFDFGGFSSYIWKWKHNVFHHSSPNVVGTDDDIDLSPIARMAPAQPRLWFHRFQRFYMWPLYGMLTVKWQFYDDFQALISGRIGRNRFPRPRGREFAILLAGKSVFLLWAIIVPLATRSVEAALLFFAVSQMTVGVISAVVFQLAHCVEGTAWREKPEDGRRPREEWAVHQVSSTMDFARGSRLVTWYVGGLNFQVAHHLFPRICHAHYPAIAPIVQSTCSEFGLTYLSSESMRAAVASHYRWLKQMGLARIAPYDA